MVMKRKVEKGEIEGYETLIKEQWKYKKYYISRSKPISMGRRFFVA